MRELGRRLATAFAQLEAATKDAMDFCTGLNSFADGFEKMDRLEEATLRVRRVLVAWHREAHDFDQESRRLFEVEE